MKNLELIFIPAPGAGHLISTLEFAVSLLNHDDRISITILAIKSPFPDTLHSLVNSMVSSHPRMTLINLPYVEPPPRELITSIEYFVTLYIDSYISHVQQAVGEILSDRSKPGGGSSSSVAGVVIDLFCVSMIDVAKEFGLPSYIYVTSNAGFLGLMLELPVRHDQIQREFRSSDPELLLPGFVKPVPLSTLPSALFDAEHGGYSTYVRIARGFREADGLIVNTFAELEPFDFGSLSNSRQTPLRVYNVGPVLSLKSLPTLAHPASDLVKWDEIWEWLDHQPSSSVVFLCFGSAGTFGEDQARQIATALERCRKSFLWSLRLRSSEKNDVGLEMVLPDGFLERTRGRGFVCGWAPQADILAHGAIGGFVSHCGWNSITESLWNGVPIATWPKYAEQQLNAYRMVKELGLSVELKLDYRDVAPQAVTADEIEAAINRLMDDDGGVRKKVETMRDLGRAAVKEGGSSFNSIGRFIEDLAG
ncbi:hypothetical protein SAY86_031957 [Trapa natans]|uniref:Glycosyltransferase n=1 Tax=Trapa natans TaxID=22666 RepID=A0AAN7LTM6_TRANT|nr:hypothetical protein SAY86_031957 [Trapa natans]